MSLFLFVLTLAALSLVESANKTETFAPSHAITGVTIFSINSDVKGSINWHLSDGGIRIEVTKFFENPNDLDMIESVYRENASHITLSLQRLESPSTVSPAMQGRMNPFLLVFCVFMTSLLVKVPSRSFVISCLILTTVVLCTLAQDSSTSSGAHVDIYVPRNFSFKEVSLVSKSGSIQINDRNLISSATTLYCSTGGDSNGCPNCCSANGICGNGSCACGYGYQNGSSSCDMQTETTFNLFVNPSSPVIFSANTPDGDQIFVVGDKDSDGIPTKVERFETVDPDGNTTFVKLDNSTSVISSAIDSSGMKMNFNWDVDANYTRVSVSIYIPETSQEFIVNLDLTANITNSSLDLDFDDSDQSTQKRSIHDNQGSDGIRKRSEGSVPNDDAHVDNMKRKVFRSKRNVQVKNTARVSVNVESCDQPENDAIVYANSLHDGAANVYTGQLSTSPGLYYIDIPTEPASTVGNEIGSVCSAIESALSSTCDWYSDIKSHLNTALSLTSIKHSADKVFCFTLATALKVISRARLILIHKFCRKILKGVDSICNKVTTTTVEGERVSDLICDAITEYTDDAIDFFRDTEIFLKPFAIFPNGAKHSATGSTLSLTPGTSSVATVFMINDGMSLSIESLNIIPYDPVPHQNYVAIVNYQCYTTGAAVTMTIIGTDSYTNTVYCTGGPSCVLHVPGAAALVVDRVTVTIVDNGVTVTRQAIIIF